MTIRSPLGSLYCAGYYRGTNQVYTHLFGPTMTVARNSTGVYTVTMSRGIDFQNRLIVITNDAELDSGWGSAFLGEVGDAAQPSTFSDTQFMVRGFSFFPDGPSMIPGDRFFSIAVFRTEKHVNL